MEDQVTSATQFVFTLGQIAGFFGALVSVMLALYGALFWLITSNNTRTYETLAWRFGEVNQRFGEVNQRFKEVNQRLDRFDNQMDQLRESQTETMRQINTIGTKLDVFIAEQQATNRRVEQFMTQHA